MESYSVYSIFWGGGGCLGSVRSIVRVSSCYVVVYYFMQLYSHGVAKSQTRLSNWTTTNTVVQSFKVIFLVWVFPTGSALKNPPTMQETWVWSLGRFPGRGHGNPLQYFHLENPMEWGAWQATVHGVRKSRTWLKRLSMHSFAIWIYHNWFIQV